MGTDAGHSTILVEPGTGGYSTSSSAGKNGDGSQGALYYGTNTSSNNVSGRQSAGDPSEPNYGALGKKKLP